MTRRRCIWFFYVVFLIRGCHAFPNLGWIRIKSTTMAPCRQTKEASLTVHNNLANLGKREFSLGHKPDRVILYSQANTQQGSNGYYDTPNPTKDSSQRVGIVGGGAIAMGTAALLAKAGHIPTIFPPQGRSRAWGNTLDTTVDWVASGLSKAEGNNNGMYKNEFQFTVAIQTDLAEFVTSSSVIVLALPANAHKHILDRIAPHLVDGKHQVILSSHASFGALYLTQLLLADNKTNIPIIAWGTTVCTARQLLPDHPEHVRINTIRTSIDACTLPATRTTEALTTCRHLFPQIADFVARDGLLAITLSNLNPQNHLGIALGNMSRMEKGENWYQSLHITPAIGRYLESLDAERLAIADALGLQVKTIFEHFSWSFHVPLMDSISDMNQKIYDLGNDVYGPNTANSRYVLEDVPFGLVPIIVLGQAVGRPAVLHEAGLVTISAMYGRNFANENDLMQALALDTYSLEDLQYAAMTGMLKHSLLPHSATAQVDAENTVHPVAFQR